MISTAPNDKCYEYRGNTADFAANSEALKEKAGVGSIFFAFNATTGATTIYILNEDSTTHVRTWVELQ